MTTLAFDRINFAAALAITALIFLFLVVFGLGRPAFAADYMKGTSSRGAGVMNQPFNLFQS